MSHTILNAQLPFVMKPTLPQPVVNQNPLGSSANQRVAPGMFDQFLTQAEKEFLTNQLQQVKWVK